MKKYLPVLLAALLLSGCGIKTDCTTAPDFIRTYSQAYRNGNVQAIMKMRAGTGLLEKITTDPVLQEELKEYARDKEEEELEQGFKNDDLWVTAWKNTEYKSEQDHGDHIRVEVLVNGIPSSVVLVRDGEFLRIHPRPSWFD
jgi:hypothetical protein